MQSIVDEGLQDKDPQAAEKNIEVNLASSVGDARNYSLLGTIQKNLGDGAKARRLFTAALVLNPTESNAARTMIDSDIADGKFADALKRIDAYTRKGGPGAQDIGGQLVKIAQADSTALTAILQGLSSNPAWRGAFLIELQKTPAGLSLMPRALAALQKSARKPTEAEIAGAVRGYLSAGDIAGAYRMFVTTRDASAKTLVSFVYDPEFKAAPSGNPFDWAIANSGAAEIRMPQSKDGGAEISFLDRPAAGFGISQMTALLPGAYDGVVAVSASDFVAPDTLYVYVRCTSGRNLTKAIIPTGTYEARMVGFKIEVPSAGCESQTLGFATNQLFQHWTRIYSGTVRLKSVRLNTLSD